MLDIHPLCSRLEHGSDQVVPIRVIRHHEAFVVRGKTAASGHPSRGKGGLKAAAQHFRLGGTQKGLRNKNQFTAKDLSIVDLAKTTGIRQAYPGIAIAFIEFRN